MSNPLEGAEYPGPFGEFEAMVRHGRELPGLLGMVALAGRIYLSAMRDARRMEAGRRAMDVLQVLPPHAGHRRSDLSRDPAPLTIWFSGCWHFVTAKTNLKSFNLFTAAVPQFIVPAAGSIALQIAALGLIPLLIGLVTDTAWALQAGRVRTWLASSPLRMSAMGRIGGISIVGVGLSVAVSGGHR